eukprot:9959596-Ditylum_brightwellii.AAC.1
MDVFPKCGQTSKISTLETSNITLNVQMEHPELNKSSNLYGNNSSFYGLNTMKHAMARATKASKSIKKKYYLLKSKHCTCSRTDSWQEIKT